MTTDTLLAVLQQSEYDWPRFYAWYQQHAHETLAIIPDRWTLKLRLIKWLAQILFWLPQLPRIQVALWLTQPAETVTRRWMYLRAQQKLATLRKNGLHVVSVAGSYAKTSTKHLLSHTLNSQAATYATPRSINTMLGISQVILKDLQPHHQVFIAEIGEYKPGQVTELMNFLTPDWGILTPIGRQHLELLGSFENVVREFQAFADFFSREKKQSHLLISERNTDYIKGKFTYGDTNEATYFISSPLVSYAGTEFVAHLPQEQSLQVFMPLFGIHQAINSLPCFWLASQLAIPTAQIVGKLASVPYLTRRHEPHFGENQVLILDNSYNTNPDSIQDSLQLLNQLAKGNRIVVTTGFVEQGDEAKVTHYELGTLLAKQADYIGLFASKYESEIIEGFLAGGGRRDQIMTGQNQADVVQKLQSVITPGSVIIFEGGYQEIHG